MFDELFPGMGMMSGMGMDPYGMMGLGSIPQYKTPGADVFSNLGISSPQQQELKGIQMQNMLQQSQIMRQREIMQMQMMGNNMGVSSAGLASGFNAPMLMAMGGMQSPIGPQLSQGINSLIAMRQGQGQGGMVPMGPQAMASQNVDPSQIIAQAVQQNGGDLGKGYKAAADQLSKIADAKNDDNMRMMATRLYQQAQEAQQKEDTVAANNAKSNAQANEANTRANSINAQLTKPVPMGTGHDASGNEGLVQSVYNPKTKNWSYTSGFWGPSLAYAIPNSPGGADKNLDSFQNLAETSSKTTARIGQLQDMVRNGAPIGWAQDGASFFNDVLGTLKQVMPGNPDVPSDVKNYMKQNFGQTFQGWANKGELGESTAQDLVMTVASGYAGGRQVSKNDVQRAEAVVGLATSNPETLIPLLDNVKQRISQDTDRAYQFYKARGVGMGPMASRYGQSLDSVYGTYKQQIATPQGGGTARRPISDFYHPQ